MYPIQYMQGKKKSTFCSWVETQFERALVIKVGEKAKKKKEDVIKEIFLVPFVLFRHHLSGMEALCWSRLYTRPFTRTLKKTF